jgi:aminoglycoside/choline kinase family phosphotransferase
MRNDRGVFLLRKQTTFPKSLAEALILEETGLSRPFRWQPLCADGSKRAFYRVASKKTSLVLIWSPSEDDSFPNENDSYVYLGRHLHDKGIPVPKIYGYNRREGLTLVEDLGSVHLQDAVSSVRGGLSGYYHQAVELLLNMQAGATEDLDTGYCFDTPVYDQAFIVGRELEYFRQSFLEGALGLKIDSDYLEGEFSQLALKAGDENQQLFFLHRDFQSRNLMLKGDLLHLIDFQGARLGPPQYDLAALLLDPYVQLPELLQKELLAAYSRRLSEQSGISAEEFLERYPHVELCRNLQVLAAFAFLTQVRKRSHFAQYIMTAWKHLQKLLTEPPCSEYQELARLVQAQKDESIAAVVTRLEREARKTGSRKQ